MRRGLGARVLLVVGLLALLAACGTKQGYGGKSVDNLAKNVNDKLALGQVTTTTKIAATAPTGKQTIGSTAPPTTAARVTATTRPVALTISIIKDAPFFEPQDSSAYVGTNVVWVNRDAVPHSVVAQNGAFHSPNIPPGQSFTWVVAGSGTMTYTDAATRPFATGTLTVLSR